MKTDMPSSPAEVPAPSHPPALILWFSEIGKEDVASTGEKHALLGEVVRQSPPTAISVPKGFAITAQAYRAYLEHNALDAKIEAHLAALQANERSLEETGRMLRRLVQDGEMPGALQQAIEEAYHALGTQVDKEQPDVAVRSSATVPRDSDASFSGQLETFLNVVGTRELLYSCQRCFASLFTDRALRYRQEKGLKHDQIGLSVGIQTMVRSDKGASGLVSTADTDTGFPDMIVIKASYGLGENLALGMVTPDTYRIYKPLLKQPDKRPIVEKRLGSKMTKVIYGEGWIKRTQTVNTNFKERNQFALSEDQILVLARAARALEAQFGQAVDIEWALDGFSQEIFLSQVRPTPSQALPSSSAMVTARLTTKEKPKLVLEGRAIGQTIRNGTVAVIRSLQEADRFKPGEILVAPATTPDWAPLMRQAAAIITDEGDDSSHAAMVSRELGIPAVVGTRDATHRLYASEELTVDCSQGERGRVYRGYLDYEEAAIDLDHLPETRTEIMMNIASPEAAFRWWRVPCQGIGLARMEFIINHLIKIHPMAIAQHESLTEGNLALKISKMTSHYPSPRDYFIDTLAMGMAQIAVSRYPAPVIVRMSDFKTNEYAQLIGGEAFEPKEENPMLGFRGASRYCSEAYQPGFALECAAVHQARDLIGADNLIVMIPFCRTLQEADQVLEEMARHGLKRGERGLKVYLMAEVPSNIILARAFAERFDGFAIGSRDLTQFILGVDRASAPLAALFDERNDAIKAAITQLINDAHACGRPVALCGQGPSDHADFAEFLVAAGIDALSVNPDSVLQVVSRVAAIETRLANPAAS